MYEAFWEFIIKYWLTIKSFGWIGIPLFLYTASMVFTLLNLLAALPFIVYYILKERSFYYGAQMADNNPYYRTFKNIGEWGAIIHLGIWLFFSFAQLFEWF